MDQQASKNGNFCLLLIGRGEPEFVPYERSRDASPTSSNDRDITEKRNLDPNFSRRKK
jgi:hypothetical protein